MFCAVDARSPIHPSNQHTRTYPKPTTAVSDTLYVYLQEDPGLPFSSTTAAPAMAAPQNATSPSPTAPELRAYLSELYGQLWDVCYLHRNLQLDVRIIYNTTAAAAPAATPRGGKGKGMGGFLTPKSKKKGKGGEGAAASTTTTPEAGSGGGGGGGGSGAMTREEALLKPELEAVFSARRDPATEGANARRAELVGGWVG